VITFIIPQLLNHNKNKNNNLTQARCLVSNSNALAIIKMVKRVRWKIRVQGTIHIGKRTL